MSFGKVDYPWNERILRGSIDEGNVLKDGGNSEDGRWRNLLMSSFNRSHEIVSSVIYTVDEIGIALRVGGPQDNDLIKTVLDLEIAVIESAFGLLGGRRLTGCLDGAAPHGLVKPWILRGYCQPVPLG